MYKRILINSRTSYCSIFSIILLVILWFVYFDQTNTAQEATKNISPRDHLVYNCCTPLNIAMRKNLFFLRTHKTGSSTVSNVIHRFAEKYSLSQMWPKLLSYYEPLSNDVLKPGTITPDNKYHVLAYHIRYTPQLKSYQYPDTVMITLLRHPAALFQSAYNYFDMEKTTGLTFEQFVKAPVKPSYLGGYRIESVYKGYNDMSVDLGFDLKNADNMTAIREFVEKIDEEFDFVMITEYMEASLILLANLMGWPLEYVVYLNLNSRNPDPYVQTEQDKQVLKELNRVDALLYDHFLEKFHRCVARFGVNEMDKLVGQLREMNRELRERCVMTEHKFGHLGTVGYVLKNYMDTQCVNVSKIYPQLN